MSDARRRFKVKGQDMVGIEVTRTGSDVTLMCGPAGWPFVRERTFARRELVRIDDGKPDDEPAPPPAKKPRNKKLKAALAEQETANGQ